MVGFGSSLRLARRTGWEGAYLDYETLKLLLSQIEAVYEEERHSRMSRENSQQWDLDLLNDELGQRKGGRHKRHTISKNKQSTGAKGVRDYKDELFLESDSEAAYLSVDEDDFTSSDEGEESEVVVGQQPNMQQHSSKPFTFTHSLESSSEEDGGEDEAMGGCIPSFGSNSGHGGKKKARKRKKGTVLPNRASGGEEEDSFYNVSTGPTGGPSNAFYMTAGNQNDTAATPTRANLPSSATDYHVSFPTNAYANESTSLLPAATATASPSASLFTAFTRNDGAGANPVMTPPIHGRGRVSRWSSGQNYSNRSAGDYNQSLSADSSPNHPYYYSYPHQPHQQPPVQSLQQPQLTATTSSHTKVDGRRKREQLSRRQRQRAKRAKRERKVPRHLRLAHAKARAITERFLGLLRAETEKVLLFAQSRIGELADTTGALRFPSFDEEYASNAYNPTHARNGSSGRPGSLFEFGDGGLHPSASSSSDEGAGGFGGRWTDSSDDDSSDVVENKASTSSMNRRSGGMVASAASNPAMMAALPNTMSGDRLSEESPATRSDQDDGLLSRKDATARSRDIETIRVVRRQIAHFEELRKNRAVFARNDQILGEDLLFLSAVEEADGYTAVGVELIHVLKYCCVNLIAVRKICRKHDRLLMQRMLGGYYQRIRANSDAQTSYSRNIEGVETLGGLVAQVSGDIYEAHPVLIGHMSHYKLVGVYDKKIAKLANSRTVQVVSSCLALSLSEYEVARSRADALTRLNSTNSVEASQKGDARGFGGKGDYSDASIEDPPSTASSISLTRLRFTVMSIFALREASRSKTDQFAEYVARCMLTFSGQPVAGEGLDGCSRETLDFLVSYNPDTALLLDSAVLFDGLKQSQWSRLPISSVMISVLAAATLPPSLTNDLVAPLLAREEKIVAKAVSIVPESKGIFWKGLTTGQLPKLPGRRSIVIEDSPSCVLELSRVSMFLYMVSSYT